MDVIKYVALDLHIASIWIVVMSAAGKVLMELGIATSAAEIRKFFAGLRGRLTVTFEESTLSQWAYEVIEPMVEKVVVCNPRRNKYLEEGSKSDEIDAHKLADLLRTGMLKAVYHGQKGFGAMKDVVRSYLCLSSDCSRVMNRLKAVFRSRGIRTVGRSIYYERNRQEWLNKLDRPEKRRRAEILYKQFDCLRELKKEAKREMLAAARKQEGYRSVISIPGLGPIFTAIILAVIVTPHRFRSKRQLWSYCGLSVITRSSSDYEFINGRRVKSRKFEVTRGLTVDFNHLLKWALKTATIEAIKKEPFHTFYSIRTEAGMSPEMARLTVARKIAALILVLWKKGDVFDEKVIMKSFAA